MNKKPDQVPLEGVNRKRILRSTTAAATRYGLTSTQHLGMVASTINAVGGNMMDIVASPATIKRHRKAEQKAIATKVQRDFMSKFKSQKKVLHWDGKVTEFLDTQGMVYQDCNAVVLSVPLSDTKPQFIGAPVVDQGTGEKLAESAIHCVNQWEAADDIVAMVFDTTSSNTGIHQGAAVFIEEMLDRALLWPACRHHVAELHIKWPYDKLMGATTGPDDPLFKKFHDWFVAKAQEAKANGAAFPDTGLFATWQWDDRSPTGPYRNSVTWWARATLTWIRDMLHRNTFPRGDYLEMSEVMNIILGGEVFENPPHSAPQKGAFMFCTC